MGIGNRIDKSENYYRPGGAGGTPRKIPEPTDQDLIEIVSTLYDAIGDNVEYSPGASAWTARGPRR